MSRRIGMVKVSDEAMGEFRRVLGSRMVVRDEVKVHGAGFSVLVIESSELQVFEKYPAPSSECQAFPYYECRMQRKADEGITIHEWKRVT